MQISNGPIYLQCQPQYLNQVLDQLKVKPFISTSFSSCTNITEARKIKNVQIIHINPKCTCQQHQNDTLYLTPDLKPFVEITNPTLPLSQLSLHFQALQHSKTHRNPIYEDAHYELAKSRMNMLAPKKISKIFLISTPDSESVNLAIRIKNALKTVQIQCLITNFGPSITEQKLGNLVFTGEFVQVSSCNIQNVPWMAKKWQKNVLCIYEFLVKIGVYEVDLAWESDASVCVRDLEEFVQNGTVE